MTRSLLWCCAALVACGDNSDPLPPTLQDVALTTPEDTPLSFQVPLSAWNADATTFTVVTPPSHGALGGKGPTWTYTPTGNYNGEDVVVVRAEDAFGQATATVSIQVAPVNDAPAPEPDSFAAGFETPLTIAHTTLLQNDTDVDSSSLTITAVTAGTHGTPSINSGNVVFMPATGFEGVATFSYTVSDEGLNAETTVTVTVGADQAPVAADDTATTDEDTALELGHAVLLANDTDVEHQTLAISAVGAATHGSVSLGGNQITFTPDANYAGAASFEYTITDGYKTGVATVAVTVNPVNDVPVAVADLDTTDEDVVLTLPVSAIVANDTDIDNDMLTVTAVTGGSTTHGTVTLSAGTVTYTPAADYNGSAELSYTVADGNGGEATATLTITVNAVNDAPVAVADTRTTAEDTALSFAAAELTANDTDIDADALTVTAVAATASTHGTVALSAGSITYTPAANYNGAAAFDYTISDGHGLSSTGTVAVTVTAANDAPVVTASTGTVAYSENAAAQAVDSGIAVTDIDSSTLASATIAIGTGCAPGQDALALTSPPAGITVSYVAATCTLTLTGVASIASYQTALRQVSYENTSDAPSTSARIVAVSVADGSGGEATATVTITVNAVNDAPVAVADTRTTAEDTALSFAAAELTGNDTDVDGDALTVTGVAVTASTHGTVALSAGSITYTPAANYNGAAAFDYTISDGHGGVSTGSVAVTVTAANDAPVVTASAGTAAYTENAAAQPVDPGITVTDLDSSTLASATVAIGTGCAATQDVLALTSPPAGVTVGYAAATCTLTLSGVASIASYQAALRQVSYANTSEAPSTSARIVTFTVDDGEQTDHSGSDSRGLGVTAVDDAPVAVDDSATTDEDAGAAAIAVLANDTDVDAGAMSIASVTQPANGTVVITGGGTGLTYQPKPNYCNASSNLGFTALVSWLDQAGFLPGPPPVETFTYTLSPGGATATVTVSVTCSDDAPSASSDVATVVENSTANVIYVLANDSDIDGGVNSVASITQPGHGSAAISSDGFTVTYTPAAGYCNEGPNIPPDTFTYTVAPGGSSSTVSVTVTCACGQNKSTDFVVGSN